MPKNYIERAIDFGEETELKAHSKVFFLGQKPEIGFNTKNKKGKTKDFVYLLIFILNAVSKVCSKIFF